MGGCKGLRLMMSQQMLSDVIYLYMVMTLLYMVIPLIMYLVSPVQNDSLKKTDLWSFFFFQHPLGEGNVLKSTRDQVIATVLSDYP
jgi:hypothetical protein